MATPRKGYFLPDGTKVPSVTTITGRFKDSGGLIWWACRQGQQYPDEPVRDALYKQRAAQIGTAVHSMVEAHCAGDDLPTMDELAARQEIDKFVIDETTKILSGFDAFLSWQSMTRLEITHQEIRLVDPEFQFGGCPDAVGTMDGVPCLIDWKTSNSVYSDMLLQLAAYGYLVEFGLLMESDYQKLGMPIDGGFHLCRFSKENGDFSHHYFPDLTVELRQFIRLRRAYADDQTISKRVK